MRSLAFVLLAFLIAIARVVAATPEDEAKKLFARYADAERAFDPTVADLYSDEAKILNKRTFQDGSTRLLSMPAAKYKELLRQAMPRAKERGDTNVYSEIKYVVEGEKIRITATRFSDLKKYSSPISLLVGPSTDGKWLIYEELSESKQ